MALLHRARLAGGEEVLSLAPAQEQDPQQIFAEGKACGDCGGIHQRACPRIRRQAWIGQGSGAGTRTEVEYWRTWADTGVIWPEDAFDDEDPEDASGR